MTPLAEKTYILLKTVPKGRITTYKALADALGTKAYRAIGQIMRNNPYSFEEYLDLKQRVPCHRVVASDGTIGGFKGEKTGETIRRKIALLRKEGVIIRNNRVVDFKKMEYVFDKVHKRAL